MDYTTIIQTQISHQFIIGLYIIIFILYAEKVMKENDSFFEFIKKSFSLKKAFFLFITLIFINITYSLYLQNSGIKTEVANIISIFASPIISLTYIIWGGIYYSIKKVKKEW